MEPLIVALAIAGVAALAAIRRRQRRHPRGARLAPRGRYPGDHEGPVDVVYAPAVDGAPDPGEVVWTWVPYEEDHSKGKDRPVLLIGRDGPWLLALQMTSRDHALDAEQEARWGRHWMDIGSGAWDRRRRPSEVRLDRIIRVAPGQVRREGAVLDRRRFEAVARSLSEHHHW